jgi:phosphate transport system permease protein
MLIKGHIDRVAPAESGAGSATAPGLDRPAESEGRIERKFNTRFFTNGTSREPELAGIAGAALVGSLYTLLVTLLVQLPDRASAPRSIWRSSRRRTAGPT